MAEFHDLAEVALNRQGQSWGNLGYWQSETEYSDACRALALLLGAQAGLDQQSLVFDAGFGCGDQLLLWLEHFRVAQVRGANLSRSQTAYAKAKLAKAGFPAAATAIVQDDINDAEAWTAALGEEKPSHVLALDCAYHFPDRVAFIALVRRDLYLSQLQEAGFGDIRIIDISEHVMPGFARFIRTFRGSGQPGLSGRLKYAVTGRFLQWAYRRSILRYCLISATKTGR